MKSVDDAVAVHEALDSARLSVTVTSPIGAPIVVPGAPEPRFAAPGAVIVSAPDVTVKVRVVSGSPLATVAAARWSEVAFGLAKAAAGANVAPMTTPAASAVVIDFR